MGFWRGASKIIGHAIDLRIDRWCDLPWLKKSTLFYWDHIKKIFTAEKAEHPENFVEAVDRLNLTPESLAKQARQYFLLTVFFAFSTLGLLAYAILTAYLGNWMGTCISISLALYASSLLFRFYLWYFQITHKKLGCTFQEWRQSISFFKRIQK